MTEIAKKFIQAFINRDWDTVCEMIENGTDVNIRNELGDTALMEAVKAKNIGLVKFIISKGAKIIENKEGFSPLTYAEILYSKENTDYMREIVEYLRDCEKVEKIEAILK